MAHFTHRSIINLLIETLAGFKYQAQPKLGRYFLSLIFCSLISTTLFAQTYQSAIYNFDGDPVSGGIAQSAINWNGVYNSCVIPETPTYFTAACNGHVNTMTNNFKFINMANVGGAGSCNGASSPAGGNVLRITYTGLQPGTCYKASFDAISTYCAEVPPYAADVSARMYDASTNTLLATFPSGTMPQQTVINRGITFTPTSSSVYMQVILNSAGQLAGNDFGIDNITVASSTYGTINSAAICSGGNATLTGMTNTGGTQIWQYSDDNEVSWNNVAANANQTGITTTSLGLVNYTLPAGQTTRKFRLKMTTSCATTVYSNVSTLTINSPAAPIITAVSQPSCTSASGIFIITNYDPSATYTFIPTTGISRIGNTITAVAGTYSVTVTKSGCPASSPLTVNVQPTNCASDLTPIITFPATTFIPNQAKDFIVKLSEILGNTTSGTIAFSVSVPTGYKITMNAAATSVTVTGAGTPIGSPIPVSNALWTATSNGDGQIDVVAKPGMNITGNSFTNVGFHLERLPTTVASVGNIVVNIYPDPTLAYDTNSANNNYSRTITGTK